MKPLFICLLMVLGTIAANAQGDRYANSYVSENGKVHFFSSTPLENIEATTNSAMCVVNTDTRKVSAKITIQSFKFKSEMMQEHFNENYLESDKYPTSTLEATIVEKTDFTKDGTYNITLDGTLDMHGVKQPRKIPGTITIKNGQVQSATASFDVKLEDHKIKIPTAVVAKIAEVIKVDASFSFQKYQKK